MPTMKLEEYHDNGLLKNVRLVEYSVVTGEQELALLDTLVKQGLSEGLAFELVAQGRVRQV